MFKIFQTRAAERTPLRSDSGDSQANCFNAVRMYFGDASELGFFGPEEFIAYMNEKFQQVDGDIELRDVTIIWSRNDLTLPLGEIRLTRLDRNAANYPFGLVIEHAFVHLEENRVFQKRDPSAAGPFEIVPYHHALVPYLDQQGFEVTRHRRL